MKGKSGGGSALWQMISVILVGVIVLLATDTIQINKSNNEVLNVNNADGTTANIIPNKQKPYSEIVETKHHPDATKAQEGGEQQQQQQQQQQEQQQQEQQQQQQQEQQQKQQQEQEQQEEQQRQKEVQQRQQEEEQRKKEEQQRQQEEEQRQQEEQKRQQEQQQQQQLQDIRSRTYRRRGQPLNDTVLKAITDQYGSWNGAAVMERPALTEDIYDAYPHRDIPRDKLPPNAWQTDTKYLSTFLPEGIALVTRAINGILAEYGKETTTAENFQVHQMFQVHQLDSNITVSNDLPVNPTSKNMVQGSGGFTTAKSWEGLKRRLLHAIMTEDYFVFAMVGHSSAAGHGNHFSQSYTLQVQWILEAVFARLGVRHQARNFGNGGLGTLQHSMGAGSVFGPDVDMIMWDSSMTEKEKEARDMVSRQSILNYDDDKIKKVPVLVGIAGSELLGRSADADFIYHGTGRKGIPQGKTVEEIEKMPWAVQYISCVGELHGLCRKNEYKGKCWIDREDFTPTRKQNPEPGGRASWHPGNRIHQLKGRVLAMIILQALREVLVQWNEAPDYKVEDHQWHVTEYYDAIRSKVRALDPNLGTCHKYDGKAKASVGYMCQHPMKARTEFTPRAYPALSNIRNLMRPEMLDLVGGHPSKDPVYDPPDVYNPNLHPPVGEVDVLTIVEAGGDFQPVLEPQYPNRYYKRPTFAEKPKVSPLGKGMYLDTKVGDQFCDGSVDSWCGKGPDNDCLLYGHNDGRHGIMFSGYSGWMVLNIPDLKNGFIQVKVESWHHPEDMRNGIMGWNSINNETDGTSSRLRRHQRQLLRQQQQVQPQREYDTQQDLHSSDFDPLDDEVSYSFASFLENNSTATTITGGRKNRRLKRPTKPYCDDFHFEFAIDGKITSWNLTEYEERKPKLQRVVELINILDDPNYTGGKEMEVELAMRIVGCGNLKVLKLNHIYWS